MNAWAVLLAGGRGTRLWPLSTDAHPKQLLAVDGRDSLLRTALLRILPVVPAERVLVVTAPDLREAVLAELPEVQPSHVLAEPAPRGTAPAIAWAAAIAAHHGADVVIALPTDHAIADADGFRAALAEAVSAARDRDAIVLLGMAPDRPDTGYGYLTVGDPVAGTALRAITAFEEKPDAARAASLVARGALWNAGVAVIPVPCRALSTWQPRTVAAIDAFIAGDADAWRDTEATSFDRGVLEHATDLFVRPCGVGWSDLGTFATLAEQWPAVDAHRAIADRVVSIDADGCAIHAPGRVVVLVGVEDLLIIDTGEVLMIARKGDDAGIARAARETR